jgi:acyl CoA:acetate/3-ketoacid CoA transferase alpha subunit
MFGGFMGVGTATRVVAALVERGARGLTIIGNVADEVPVMRIVAARAIAGDGVSIR